MKTGLPETCRRVSLRAVLAGLALLPAMALAHEEKGQAAGFVAGLAHPISGTDHVLAMIAVGLWGAVLGAMVLAEIRPPLWIAAVVVAFFAVFHGHAHGRELPEGTSALLYSLGFVVATGLLHAVGILLGVAHRWSAGRQAVRAAGGGVALAGLYFLWRAVA